MHFGQVVPRGGGRRRCTRRLLRGNTLDASLRVDGVRDDVAGDAQLDRDLRGPELRPQGLVARGEDAVPEPLRLEPQHRRLLAPRVRRLAAVQRDGQAVLARQPQRGLEFRERPDGRVAAQIHPDHPAVGVSKVRGEPNRALRLRHALAAVDGQNEARHERRVRRRRFASDVRAECHTAQHGFAVALLGDAPRLEVLRGRPQLQVYHAVAREVHHRLRGDARDARVVRAQRVDRAEQLEALAQRARPAAPVAQRGPARERLPERCQGGGKGVPGRPVVRLRELQHRPVAHAPVEVRVELHLGERAARGGEHPRARLERVRGAVGVLVVRVLERAPSPRRGGHRGEVRDAQVLLRRFLALLEHLVGDLAVTRQRLRDAVLHAKVTRPIIVAPVPRVVADRVPRDRRRARGLFLHRETKRRPPRDACLPSGQRAG